MKTIRNLRSKSPESFFTINPHGYNVDILAEEIVNLFQEHEKSIANGDGPWGIATQTRFESDRQAKAKDPFINKKQLTKINDRIRPHIL